MPEGCDVRALTKKSRGGVHHLWRGGRGRDANAWGRNFPRRYSKTYTGSIPLKSEEASEKKRIYFFA